MVPGKSETFLYLDSMRLEGELLWLVLLEECEREDERITEKNVAI